MNLLREKFAKYDLPQQFMAKGVYPYFRTIDSHQDTEVWMDGKKVLMFGSNAYMGLTYDKRIIKAAKDAIDKYGTGCAGSRLLNGTLDIHVELEKELAEFVGKDEALCFSTGFTVNEGVIPQLVGRGDYIICDDRDHASIVDGRRLSFATQFKYKHNDMEDLEKELKKCAPDAVKLIAVDGVFSMEGDLANLPEIVRLKKKYNATIYVDEAHGIGVFGKQGRGVCDHFGVTDEVDLIMGTFSKALGGMGAYIASHSEVIDYLITTCGGFIYSTAPSPFLIGAMYSAWKLIPQLGKERSQILHLAHKLRQGLAQYGYNTTQHHTHIIPLISDNINHIQYLHTLLQNNGIHVSCIKPPTVPPYAPRLRFAINTSHTEKDIEYVLTVLRSA